MRFIKRDWTALEADNWSKEDWLAIFLSPLAYFLIALGVAGSILLRIWGIFSLLIGIVVIIILHWIIDPKLKKISSEYEKRQKDYLIALEKHARWKN